MTEPNAAQDPRRAVVAWLGSEHIVAEIRRALPDHLPVDWFMRLAQTSILMNPDLASSDRPSLLRELVAVAQLGLVLDPQMGEAWLIIDRNRNVQRRIGYQGLRKLALQSGLVTGLNSQAVYANDQTDIELGDTPHVRHKIDVNAEDRGKLLGCYAVGRVTGTEQPVVEWMSWKQIQAHRDRYSQAKSGPWSDPLAEIEMGRKTVFRRLCKWLPKSPLLADALAEEDRLDMRVINPEAPEPEPQAQRSRMSVIAARNAPPQPQFGGGGDVGPPTGATGVSREPIPQTAPGRGMPLGTNQQVTVPPQDAGYSEPPMPLGTNQQAAQAQAAPAPVSSSQEPAPPTENAPYWQQSASKFVEATIDGDVYHTPEDAALALTLLIEQSTVPGQILDDYADVMQALPTKLMNAVLAAAASSNNKRERKHADAERERQAPAKAEQKQDAPKRRGRPPGSKNRPSGSKDEKTWHEKTMDGLKDVERYLETGDPGEGVVYDTKDRPPEPAGEARSANPEPAATPAPGRVVEVPASALGRAEDVTISDYTITSPDDGTPPEWTTEETEPAPERDYTLTNTQGDIVSVGLRADAFLTALHHRIDNSRSSGEANAWKTRNKRALQDLAQAEGGDLANDALDLIAP